MCAFGLYSIVTYPTFLQAMAGHCETSMYISSTSFLLPLPSVALSLAPSIAAHFSGAIGSGTGILMAVTIIYECKYCRFSIEPLLINTFRLGNRHARVG